MIFIIHSMGLLEEALVLENQFVSSKCYIPGRDTPQSVSPKEIFDINLKNLKESGPIVYVIWDGTSQGALFDMGSAFALGKTMKFVNKTAKDHVGMSKFYNENEALWNG